MLGLRETAALVQRVTGLAHGPPPAAQFADVPQYRPHRDGGAVGVEHGFAHHVHGALRAVGAQDAELPVDGAGVDQTVRDHRGQSRAVVLVHEGGEFVEGEGGGRGIAAEDPVQLAGPRGPVGQQVPLGGPDPAEQRPAGGPGLRGGRRWAGRGGVGGREGRGAVTQLGQMGVQIGELVQRQIVQSALPAGLGIRTVRGRLAPYGVHVAAQPPGPREQRVDRAAPGRLRGGAVR